MKQSLIIFLGLTLIALPLQVLPQAIDGSTYNELPPLTPLEQFELMNMPVMERPADYATRDLPPVVDNSTQVYMRPVFNQDGYSCGQAAGIAYNFTYEINRLRNLPSNVAQNQYPTHFPWNFMNGGNGWYGSSYLHSFLILKHYGMPNVSDYGGTMSAGGPKRWMSGYPEYFNGMHNRINGFSQVYVEDEDDLLTIKGWIHDHLDGSAVGGLASFYANYMSANNVLPPGTPEAGKHVLTYFGGSPNHAMTIVGYNDSIRWDYNGDGQYTNDIDINGDGEVDIRDWEIGGFKMVQSYGGVPNWGDDGYAYMMYKTLADDLGSGGIWNHSVHILDVKDTYGPQLTARIILKHDLRNTIKVMAGLANNSNASFPGYRLGFPVFDYQGGNNYMQGGTDESDKTIEFGLDLSPLLTHVEIGHPVKFFLEVIENDPSNAGTGQVIHFSIYDHTGTVVEIISPQVNVPVGDNDTTRLGLVHTMSFDRVAIENETLPAAPQGQPYSCQMIASGGTQPYAWELAKTYQENSSMATFPQITTQQLIPDNYTDGKVTQPIDFAFPFYDSAFSSITVHVDGYLMFDEQLYPYPYFIDEKVLFRKTRNISPFMNHDQRIYPSGGDGIWYEGDTNYALFRWRTSLESYSGKQYNFAAKLYPSGEIEFYYGEMDDPSENLWISGISDSDDENFHETGVSNKPTIIENSVISLEKYSYPEEFSLTSAGMFSGIPQQSYAGVDFVFKVTDNNFIQNFKTLTLASSGVIIQDSVHSGDDGVIEYAETAYLSMLVTNIEEDTVFGATMSLSTTDNYITLTDSTETLGNLPPSTLLRFEDAFAFEVAPDVPDNHLMELLCTITDADSTWENTLFHTARAPVIEISEVLVNDENQRLDPGDTADIVVTYANYGGSGASNVFTMLETDDTLVDILDNFALVLLLEPNQQENATYTVAVSGEALNGHSPEFTTSLEGDMGYTAADTFNLVVGFQVEDFETGNFDLVDWGFAGDSPWMIDNESRQEGLFSARSGYITHEQESSLIIDMDVYSGGEISFFKRVSCEDDESANNNYDFLAFYIDGVEMGRWDGEVEWSLETFPVDAGFQRFEWRYRKDLSASHGMDGAWVDYITFPGAEESAPVLVCEPESIDVLMRPDEIWQDTLLITNNGQGAQEFSMQISTLQPQKLNSGHRSVLGSYLICHGDHLNSGNDYTWGFTLYNSSLDAEWIKTLYLDFPPGLELTATTDFTGGSNGALVFQGGLGNGALAEWHGEDASGWGVLKGNETATASLTFHAHEGLPETVPLEYEIHGDIYGSEPHIVNGEILLTNLGPEPGWIAPDTTGALIPGGSSTQIILTFNTTGMEDGAYNCRLLVSDYFSEGMEIPVSLTVDQTLDAGQTQAGTGPSLVLYPNPAGDKVNFQFSRLLQDEITISVFNPEGRMISRNSLHGAMDNQISLPVSRLVPSGRTGIYLLEILTGQMLYREKLVIINGLK